MKVQASLTRREHAYRHYPALKRRAKLMSPLCGENADNNLLVLRNNLLPGGVAPELVDDRTHGGREAAVWR